MFPIRSRRLAIRVAQGCVLLALLSTLVRAQQTPRESPSARVMPGQWAAVAQALGVAGEIRGDVFRVDFAPFAGRVWVRRVALAPGAAPVERLPFPAARCEPGPVGAPAAHQLALVDRRGEGLVGAGRVHSHVQHPGTGAPEGLIAAEHIVGEAELLTDCQEPGVPGCGAFTITPLRSSFTCIS